MTEPLSPEEEMHWMREIARDPEAKYCLETMVNAYNVLQSRSGMLLSLITLCLTITGFSGPSMAASGPLARNSLCLGLGLVLLSAGLLVIGPLQLRWASRRKEADLEQSLTALIRLRNKRTRLYHAAAFTLLAGLSSYVTGVISFLLS